MPRHNNPHPKFRKPYLSWKGRAECMREFLANNGFTVEYQKDSVDIIGWASANFTGKGNEPCHPKTSKPKRWWQVWKWW